MLQVTYRKKGIKLSHVWFAKREQLEKRQFFQQKADLYYLHGIPSDNSDLFSFRNLMHQRSIIKELDLPEGELFLSLGKHLRQYIKKSRKENSVQIEIFDWEYLINHPEIINNCQSLYEKMFQDKDLNIRFNKSLLYAYIQAGSVAIGYASIDKQPVGFSAIIYNNDNARLWLTAFDFRNTSMDSQILSRGHQRLDWEILLWCKWRGVKHFDFGGVNSFDNPDGISRFKMGFEKENKVTYYNAIVSNSLLGYFVLKTLRVH